MKRGQGKSAYAKVVFMENLLHAPFIMLFILSVLFHFFLYMQVVPTEEELPELKQDSSPYLSSS